MRRKRATLESENQHLKTLFHLIHSRPEVEAQEIFRRIRESDEPLAVLESVRQAEMLMPSPCAEERNVDPKLGRLDRNAAEHALIRVPARPWTVVVDDGLVSHLITEFFTWDDAYLFPSIDQTAFLDDMRAGDPTNAKWCSPSLVNAMCAVRSVSLTVPIYSCFFFPLALLSRSRLRSLIFPVYSSHPRGPRCLAS